MNEIKRILKKDGILLARVARIDDCNLGGKLEINFCLDGTYIKRYFDEADVKDYFGLIGKLQYKKTSMVINEEYSKQKKLFEIKVIKKQF